MKRTISLLAILGLLFCFVFAVLYLDEHPLSAVSSSVEADAQSLPVIVLDPGHGGFDGGTTSVFGVAEKEYNLSIAAKIADLLRVNGFTVAMTRTSDTATNDPNLDTIRQKKSSDLHNRMELMNHYQNCLFISIHQNYFTDSTCHGAQVFYSPNLTQSKQLAESIQQSIVSFVEPDNTRTVKKSDSSIYLLYHAQKPAVMVECGFLSNQTNAEQLGDDQFQQKIAFAVYEGIEQYLIWEESNGAEK